MGGIDPNDLMNMFFSGGMGGMGGGRGGRGGGHHHAGGFPGGQSGFTFRFG